MIKFVNAKINIGLNVVSRRPDGYHNLSTVFYPIGKESGTPLHPEPFSDILEIVPGKEEFTFTGRKIDVVLEKNLVVKAYRLFMTELGKRSIETSSFKVILDKHLPDGAGMGGGSSDASFTLMLLNELSGFPFTRDELVNMSIRLGADCPFFIYNEPCYAEGIGEILTPVSLDLSDYHFLVAKPDVYVSTAEAFAGISPVEPVENLMELIQLPVEEWQGRIINDFEAPLIKLHPEIGIAKEGMLEHGAEYASMTGSGSAVFGIFRNAADRVEASSAIKKSLPGSLLYTL